MQGTTTEGTVDENRNTSDKMSPCLSMETMDTNSGGPLNLSLKYLTETISSFKQAIEGLDASVSSQGNHLSKLGKVLDMKPAVNPEDVVVLDSLPHHREDNVRVNIHVTFLKLGEINTVFENFKAHVQVESWWHEPKLDNLSQVDIDQVKATDYWNPSVYIENVYTEPKEEKHYAIMRTNGRVYIHEYQRVKCSFYENMELYNFPFDTQDLSIKCVSTRKSTEITLKSDRVGSTNDMHKEVEFSQQQEWYLHSQVETLELDPSTEMADSIGIVKFRRAAVLHSACVTRRAGFFLWNIVLVMIFITALAFATFAIVNPENRLIPSFTLMLTMVTFKFTASNNIPKVSYLTILDTYILSCLGFMACVPAWHASSAVIQENTRGTELHSATARTADHVVVAVLAFLYIGMHITFAVIIYTRTKGKFAISGRSLLRKDEKNRQNLNDHPIVMCDNGGFVANVTHKESSSI